MEVEERNSRRQWGQGGLKGCALIRDREGVTGQTDRATWKPAVHTPAASEMGNIIAPRPRKLLRQAFQWQLTRKMLTDCGYNVNSNALGLIWLHFHLNSEKKKTSFHVFTIASQDRTMKSQGVVGAQSLILTRTHQANSMLYLDILC